MRVSEKLLKSIRQKMNESLSDVDDKAVEVQEPVFADAVRSIKKADKEREKVNTLPKAEEHKEKPDMVKVQPEAKKLHLSESLFDDDDSVCSVVIIVNNDLEIEEYTYATDVEADGFYAELSEMPEEELEDGDVLGFAIIEPDADGKMCIRDSMCIDDDACDVVYNVINDYIANGGIVSQKTLDAEFEENNAEDLDSDDEEDGDDDFTGLTLDESLFTEAIVTKKGYKKYKPLKEDEDDMSKLEPDTFDTDIYANLPHNKIADDLFYNGNYDRINDYYDDLKRQIPGIEICGPYDWSNSEDALAEYNTLKDNNDIYYDPSSEGQDCYTFFAIRKGLEEDYKGKDTFFTQDKCDRCGGSLEGGRTMSMFNTDCICMKCKEEEKKNKDYKKAKDAEIDQVRKGNYNYDGIGLSNKNEGLDDKCCICGGPLGKYGNNAEPVKSGRCCDKCNYEVVLPTRLGLIKSNLDECNKSNKEIIDEKLQGPEIEEFYKLCKKVGINDLGDLKFFKEHEKVTDDEDLMKKLREWAAEADKYDEQGNLIVNESLKLFREDLAKHRALKEDFVTDNGLSSVVNALIQDEWQAIQGYKDAIVNFETSGNQEYTKILDDILNEENVHVGQLQSLLASIDSSAKEIKTGEQEAASQLGTEETIIATII